MTRIISVVSGKGGVGKTTITSNLGTELSKQGHDVLIIDGNFSGANVSQHFGLDFQEVSLNDVLNGDAYITQAVSKHKEGVSILPASVLDFNADAEKLRHSIVDFLGEKEFVLIDAGAGVGEEVEAAVQASDEVLLVAEPELPSLTNAVGAKNLAEQLEKDVIGLALNGVRNEKTEVEKEEAQELLDTDVVAEIPDHKHVREGIALKEPVVTYKPRSKPANKIEDLSYIIKGEKPPKRGVQDKLAEKATELNII